jgi:two-component system response regulator
MSGKFAQRKQKLSILVAEDDPREVTMINLALIKDGIPAEVQMVNDGEQVVEYLAGKGMFADRARSPFPDPIVVDLRMARMGGIEVVKWLRQDEQCARLPIVILSGSGLAEDVDRAYEAGANSYFQKPHSIDALQTLLKAIAIYWLLTERPGDGLLWCGGEKSGQSRAAT